MIMGLILLAMVVFGSCVAWNQDRLRENPNVVAIREALKPLCDKLP